MFVPDGILVPTPCAIRPISFANEFPQVNGSSLIAGRTVTYGIIVAEIIPQKAETHRTRLTVGGNLINLPGDVTTSTADLIMDKLIFNSVLSTKNEKFMGEDMDNFYINNPMDRYEYMKLTLGIIPEEIIEQYNIRNLAHKGYIYMEIQKGMYGLPQAGKFSNDRLSYILPSFDTSQHASPQVYGGTKTAPSNFHWLCDVLLALIFDSKVIHNQ